MKRVLIWLHGGAWIERHASERSHAIMTAHGLDVMRVTHRLSHEATWPAQLDDVRDAARKVRADNPGVPLLVPQDRIRPATQGRPDRPAPSVCAGGRAPHLSGGPGPHSSAG
ncbi:alpha/beta hydrolase fold domain-containing protein [Sphaerisporangium flaviroseum]|uniref:alpha/beta hydrolase fold domain-containing protein n=1 Tax=Sphaerisporangium flaviroseum TaxID=509199 RepID=UPI003CD0A85B